jgi:transcriptional accessory protein Tex/SPT6
VARILDRGVVVNIGSDVEGFIPLNQLGRESVNHPSRLYKVGDVIPAEIVEFDLDSKKIVLSVEDYFNDKAEERKSHEAAFPLKPAEGRTPVKPRGKKHDEGETGAEKAEVKAEEKKGDEKRPKKPHASAAEGEKKGSKVKE